MPNKYASVRPWRPLLILVLRPGMHPVCTLDSFLKPLQKVDISQAITCVKGAVCTLIGRRLSKTHP